MNSINEDLTEEIIYLSHKLKDILHNTENIDDMSYLLNQIDRIKEILTV
jgi:hypothetical protein